MHPGAVRNMVMSGNSNPLELQLGKKARKEKNLAWAPSVRLSSLVRSPTFRMGKMRRFFLSLLSALLMGCNSHNVFDALAGKEYEVMVLAKDPVVIDKKPLTLHADRPMKVVGNTSMICFALRDEVSSRDATDELFNRAMNGTKLDVSIKLTSGDTLQFFEPMQSWRREGRILKSGEFSGCAYPCCPDKAKLLKGDEVTEVRIVASKPLEVRGIFWESTNSFDNLRKKP
jgi:hypothetical protein